MANLIEWKDDFLTGITSIDEQHKVFVSYINELYDAIHSERGAEVVEKTLAQLIAYGDTHFAFEEKYFKEFGYPDMDAHIAEHNAYRERIAQFVPDHTSGDVRLAFEVLDFLEDWCLEHLVGSDHKYVQYFKKHGLA